MKVGDFVTPETDQEYNAMKFGEKYPVIGVEPNGYFYSKNKYGKFFSRLENDNQLNGKNWKLIPSTPLIQIPTGIENGIIVNTIEAMNYIISLENQIKSLTSNSL